MEAELAEPAPAETTTETTHVLEMVFPEQANHYGTLYGGTALSLLSKAAFIAASRCVRRPMVMASSERIEFLAPVKVGEMLDVAARVIRIGRSSVTVSVEAEAECLTSGERRPALRGSFKMVAVDERGHPVPIRLKHSQHQIEEIGS